MNTPRSRQRGLSIVELMIGLALGLFIIGAALLVLTRHLHESRSLLLEARLMQDLRTAADLMARDLRRAGHWGASSPGLFNPYAGVDASGNGASFSYSRDASENHAIDSNERFAYRLRDGAIQMRLGDGAWQAMTDAGTVVVTSLRISPTTQVTALDGFCSRACPAGSAACPPRHRIHSLAIAIAARAAGDPAVTRSVQATVRLRNDEIVGACPT